jgi:protein-S-isoprenylcysteine O-methyltransferase Ste14
MGKTLILLYGCLCYLLFLSVVVYTMGFVGDFVVPKSINSGSQGEPSASMLVDLLLMGLFAVPHSIMARRGFKEWWTRIVPPPAERSTYVLISSLLLALLLWQWRPLPAMVWEIVNPIGRLSLYALSCAGWIIVFWSTFSIDHFDLFGLRQLYYYARGETYRPVPFRMPILYRIVRHPLMMGFLLAFWSTPRLTVGHLLFAVANTLYILVAVRLEEGDLVARHGDVYRDYQRRVSMLLPVGLFRRR